MPDSIQIPHLRKTETSRQLVVDGRPFLSLAAELQNSSLTSAEYMDTVWQKLVDANINTVLGCVTWEDIEPVEDQFNFSELDQVVLGARKHGLRLVLLWFGSFKNGMSLSKVMAGFCLGLFDQSIDMLSPGQVYPLTCHHGSRRTPNGSLGQSYAKPVVYCRLAMCCRFSTRQDAKLMLKLSPH